MASAVPTTYTYADLERFPDDNLRREIIDGELIVTPAPRTRHQEVVMRLAYRLHEYALECGGRVYPAPLDVFFAHDNVVEPDVVFVVAKNLERIEEKFIRGAPDLVVEVSSPTQRRLELVRKRDLYERFKVPEYWYVDLDADRVEVRRLAGGRFAPPELHERDDVVTSMIVDGFSIPVDELLGFTGP